MADKNPIYDEKRISEENLTELLYNYHEDGNYTHHVGYDYLRPEELLMHDMLKMMSEKLEQIRKKVIAGELSPISYFMEKTSMEPGILSQFVGMPARRVKKHLKPAGFSKLDREQLARYADAFEIQVEQLVNFDIKE